MSPNIASVSTMDPDHLDIYGVADKLKIAFEKFVANLNQAVCFLNMLALLG